MKRLLPILLCAGACSATEQPQSANAVQADAPHAASATPAGAGYSSTVSALRITPVGALPRGLGVGLDDYCSDKVTDARSPQARAVEARGWHVTAEQPVGRYLAVSFAGRFEPMTSGVCGTSDGNVALFDGERLVAIVHAARSGMETPRLVTALEEQGRLRIWGEEHAPPLADLVVSGDGVTVAAVAPADRWCDGAVSVPNVFVSRIREARTHILRAGWRADPPAAEEIAESSYGVETELRREGVTEVQSCSGTGYALCAFSYRSRAGPTLDVTTAGEEQRVVYYAVECRPHRQ
jgi:hypothetical protein